MGESVEMRMPVGTVNISGMICETELVVHLSAEGSIPRIMNAADSSDRSAAAHVQNVSPLAAIDVYSLPDENEVRSCVEAPSN